jgi:hypothetical protein
MKLKNPKSNSAYSGPIQDNAPNCKRYLSIKKFRGTVIVNTNITAKPIPIEVLTVLETAKYEHIPRKYAKTIFSMKMLFINKFAYSII